MKREPDVRQQDAVKKIRQDIVHRTGRSAASELTCKPTARTKAMQQRTASFWDRDPQVNDKRCGIRLPVARFRIGLEYRPARNLAEAVELS